MSQYPEPCHVTWPEREVMNRVRGIPPQARAASVMEAVGRLARSLLDPLGHQLVEQVSARCGLSTPMVRWAVESQLGPITADGLLRIRARAVNEGTVMDRVTVVLAGNVVTGPIVPLCVGAVLGSTVVVKASSGDDSMAALFHGNLSEVCPVLGNSLVVHTSPRRQSQWLELALQRTQGVVIFGDDETIRSLRGLCGSHVPVGAHGHGMGVAVVRATGLGGQALASLCEDVCAFDQRGCLSVRTIFFDGSESQARAFAVNLCDAMGDYHDRFPMGTVPPAVAADLTRWRARQAITGFVVGTGRGAVSVGSPSEPSGLGSVAGPGYRHVAVIPVAPLEKAARWITRSVKVVVTNPEHLAKAREALRLSEVTRCCGFGEAQHPDWTKGHDGVAPYRGFVTPRSYADE